MDAAITKMHIQLDIRKDVTPELFEELIGVSKGQPRAKRLIALAALGLKFEMTKAKMSGEMSVQIAPPYSADGETADRNEANGVVKGPENERSSEQTPVVQTDVDQSFQIPTESLEALAWG